MGRFVFILGAALVGCSAGNTTMMMPDGGGPGSLPDGDDSDGGGNDGSDSPDLASSTPGNFVTATHLPFPLLKLHTTTVFAAPQLVTITYSDFGLRDKVEKFGDFLVTSSWLAATGAEYGIGQGVHLKKLELAAAAPKMTTDAAIVKFIKQQITAAALPAPSATNNQLLYLVYFPMGTTINDGTGAKLCQNAYSGYHSYDQVGGVTFVYAVLPDCTGMLDELTSTVSHEVIESVTDPEDAWYLDVPADDHWSGLRGQEVGDLCQDYADVHEAGWALQRSWSNAAAMAGASPCVPIPSGELFMNVSPSPATAVKVAAGTSTTFTLDGWSTAATADWALSTSLAPAADFDPMPSFSNGTINNGASVTVTLTVPAGTAAGKIGSSQVYSGPAGNFWPLTVVAK